MFSYPKFYAEDGNGDPLRGGKLYSYKAGTSTAKVTYSEGTLTTGNDNPTILNSRGEATVYLAGTYKFILKDKDDNIIWTLDDIEGANEAYVTYHYPNADATDQGATGNSDTIKYAVDTISTNNGTIFLRHNSGSATTTYTLTTSETISSTTEIIIEKGANIDGAGTLTFADGSLLGVKDTQKWLGSTITIAGLNRVSPDWWTTNTTPGTTDMTAAINKATIEATPVTVITQPVEYFISSHVYVPRQTSWVCEGGNTTIKSTNGTSSVIIGTDQVTLTITPGYMQNVFIRDTDYDYKASSIGLIFGGVCAVDAVDRAVSGFDLINVRCEGFDIGMVSFNRIFNNQFTDCVWSRNNYNIKISQQGRSGGYQARFIGGQITNARKLGYWVYGGSVDAMSVRFMGTYIQNNGLHASLAEGAIKLEANNDSAEGGVIGYHSFMGCHISQAGAKDVPTIQSDEGTLFITNGLVTASSDTNPGESAIEITGGYFFGQNFRVFGSNAAYAFETTGATGGSLSNINVSGTITGIWDAGSSANFLVQNVTNQTDNTPKDQSMQGDLQVIGDITGFKSWISNNIESNTVLSVDDCRAGFLHIGAAITVTLPAVSAITSAATNTSGADIVFLVRDNAEVATIIPNAADKINLYGTVLDAGDTIDSAGTKGDWVRLISSTRIDGAGTDGWIALVGQGTWVDGGQP